MAIGHHVRKFLKLKANKVKRHMIIKKCATDNCKEIDNLTTIVADNGKVVFLCSVHLGKR